MIDDHPTVRRKLSALSSLFEDLVARGAAPRNPVEGVERPGEDEDTNAAPVLTQTQARKLLDAPDGNTLKGRRDRVILAVLLYQGLTREELCGLPRAAVPVLGMLGAQIRLVLALALAQIVAAVLAEILRRGGGRGQVADRRDHDRES